MYSVLEVEGHLTPDFVRTMLAVILSASPLSLSAQSPTPLGAGFDELDPSTVDVPVADYAGGVGAPTAGLRLGVPTAGFFEDLNPEVAAALEAALEVLGELTAGVREVDVPAAGSVVDIWNPEIYAYHEPWITKSPELYQEPTRRLIERAEATSAAVYADARRRVDILRRDIERTI